MNIQRSPLGGRGFESFSEDPFLSGSMGAATVAGIQSTGVAATTKHFVCNDQEHERKAVSAIVTERALREIYLMPFMITERDSKPKAYMTGYNKLNGISCSEDPKLLKDILRGEWKYDGLVMSDWSVQSKITHSVQNLNPIQVRHVYRHAIYRSRARPRDARPNESSRSTGANRSEHQKIDRKRHRRPYTSAFEPHQLVHEERHAGRCARARQRHP